MGVLHRILLVDALEQLAALCVGRSGVAQLVVVLLEALGRPGLDLLGRLHRCFLPQMGHVHALLAREQRQDDDDEDVRGLEAFLGRGGVDGGAEVQLLGHCQSSIYYGGWVKAATFISMLEEDDSAEQREVFIQEMTPRYSKAKSEHLPRNSELLTRRLHPMKQSSTGLTKIATSRTMTTIAIVFVAVGFFYSYVSHRCCRFRG